jgi:hypothetical protein
MLSMVEKRDVPEDASRRPGLIWRTMASIIVLLGWLLFATVWTFFLAGDLGYNEYQSWSVCLATVLVMAALAGAIWVPWGLRHQSARDRWMWTRPGFSSRVWVSGGVGSGLLLFLVLWLWTFADRFTRWQNLGAAIILLIVGGIVMSAIWVPWGMRHPAREWEARRSTLEDEISERVKAEVHAALERELDKGR